MQEKRTVPHRLFHIPGVRLPATPSGIGDKHRLRQTAGFGLGVFPCIHALQRGSPIADPNPANILYHTDEKGAIPLFRHRHQPLRIQGFLSRKECLDNLKRVTPERSCCNTS